MSVRKLDHRTDEGPRRVRRLIDAWGRPKIESVADDLGLSPHELREREDQDRERKGRQS